MRHLTRDEQGGFQIEVSPDPQKPLYSPAEAASYWRIPVESVMAAVKRGDLDTIDVTIDGRPRISGEIVEHPGFRPHPSGKGVYPEATSLEFIEEVGNREAERDPTLMPDPPSSGYEWL